MRVVKKNNLQKVTGSRNINIPMSTAPTAPIPVHTGYAVPKGISATPSKAIFDYISFFSFCINAFKIDGKITYFATNLLFLQQLLK